jgi:hypothetical protein
MFRLRRRAKQVRSDGAVALLTFPKAGSQWVRDLLAHELAKKHSSFADSMISVDLAKSDRWPELRKNHVIGPIYSATPDTWLKEKSLGDKAVIVLRDPRDLIVSFCYSRAYSHVPTESTERLRKSMLTLPLQQLLMVCINLFVRRYDAFKSWAKHPHGSGDSLFLTTYEKLVSNTESELAAVYDFLGWPVPQADVERIVGDLAFETRSGRAPGDEEIYSHYRKGAPGDWRRHFDRPCGVLFECLFPHLLVESDYEDDPRWFEKLPASLDGNLHMPHADNSKAKVELQAEVVRLREQIARLERVHERRRTA